MDKINWETLSRNPNAMHLLAPLDHEKMRDQCREFTRELLNYYLHPNRLMRIASTFDMDLEEYIELIY
jgi:hypothetical protein